MHHLSGFKPQQMATFLTPKRNKGFNIRSSSIFAMLVAILGLFVSVATLAKPNACEAIYSDASSPEDSFFKLLKELINGKGITSSMSNDELAIARRTVNEFPIHGKMDMTVMKAAEDLILKIIFQSQDLEKTYSLINSLGLRYKFYNALHVTENGPKINTLWWWLNKVPLPTRPLGTTGKTASDLGLTIVAHNTHSQEAVQSIVRPKNGRPNVFISRFLYPGETAMHGDGFYTKIGNFGAGGSGHTVKFEVDPKAREGEDFKIIGGDYVIFFNRLALKVLVEK